MVTSPRQPKQPRKRLPNAERRAVILHSARTVFVKGGYSGARMKEVAALSDVTEAVVYQHFGSKEALFEAAVMEPLERWMEDSASVGPQLAAAADANERIEVGTRFNAHYLAEIREMMPLLSVALFANEGSADFYRRRIVPLFHQWAENGRTSLGDWSRDDVDVDFLARVNFSIPMLMAMEAHFTGTELDIDRLARQITEVMLRATTKPEKLDESAQGSPGRNERVDDVA